LRKKLSEEQTKYLESARVARLATEDLRGTLSLVPIVFANKGDAIYFVIDKKTKTSSRRLKRLRNISENPNLTLLVDQYSEDWDELSYLMLICTASIVEAAWEKKVASTCLRRKYSQYREEGYFPDSLEEAIIVKLIPKRAVFWQNLRSSVA
jgi:PPOX class probable F420-dependent enzyme